MKKIAIMTWYTHRNYGTALQACATNYLVEKLGYAPSFIQYIPKRGAYTYDRAYFTKRCVLKVKGMLNPVYLPESKEEKYADFLAKRITQTQKCNCYAELHDLNNQFDAFLCGSDQIWTPLNHDDKYFLSFVSNPDKMIAYAPSLGVSKISDPLIGARMGKLISRFNHLSVREEQGAELVYQLTGMKPQVVLDPTLLLNSTEWDELADVGSSETIAEKEYIICYFLGNADKYMRYVRVLSEKLNLPYYLIPVTRSEKKDKHAVPFEVGPSEFVSLIRGAKYVCTDSFHGVAFAANYKIPFSAFKRFKDRDSGSQNSRVINLLNILHLQDRLCDHEHPYIPANIMECNFSGADVLLEKKRKESTAFLEQSLARAVSTEARNPAEMVITDTCCGCGACATVCPHLAISIQKDADGFEHYSIDQSKCVRCGLCRKVCPMTNVIAPNMHDSKALYAVKSSSVQVLQKSSSGGIGHGLASLYLSKGHAVCGCAYDKDMNTAKHIWILPGEAEKLHLLQGSKYIQSISADALLELPAICKDRKIVFFGTPCQTAAVDKILRRKNLRERALLVDLICHGVPSYHLWSNYLHSIDRRYAIGNHPHVVFRDKTQKSHQRIMHITGNGHDYKNRERKDDFYAFFRRGICDMESCFECPYRERSAADLRIGDYWGNRFEKEMYGMSMVISNTDKGEEALSNLQQIGVCSARQYELDEYWSVQCPTNSPMPLVRDELLRKLKDPSLNIHALRKKYCVYYDVEEDIFKLMSRIKRIVR